MVERGYQSDRLHDAASDRDDPRALAALEQQIDRLEKLRDAIEREEGPIDRNPPYGGSTGSGGYTRNDDGSRGR